MGRAFKTTKAKDIVEQDIRRISEKLGFEFHEYLEVLDVFLENTPGVIEDFKLCMENNRLVKASELCHLIKGGASSIGLDVVSGVAHEIEKACKEGDTSRVPDLTEKLISLVKNLEKQRKLTA